MSSFLGDFARRMGVYLLSVSFPLQGMGVVFGQEGFNRDAEDGPYVQVLNDPGGDAYEAGTAQQGAATTMIKYQGVLVHFQAASSKAGATEDDHVQALESLVDAFVYETVVLCHKYKCRLRNMRSTQVVVGSVGANATQQVAKLDMQLQIGRGINQPEPTTGSGVAVKNSLSGLTPSSSNTPGVLTPEVLYSGDAASMGALTDAGATITGLELGASDDCAGLTLIITGAATPANNGAFRIQLWNDDTSVNIINAAAVTPDANNGALAWQVIRSEFAVPGVT
jgi:hypothetical protein